MTENPYESPSTIEPLAPPEPPAERPPGVLILSILYILGGVFLLADIFKLMYAIGVARFFVLFSVPIAVSALLVPTIVFLAGLGMMRGARWGWCLAAFYSANNVMYGALGVLAFAAMAIRYTGNDAFPENVLIWRGISQLVIFGLVLAYLCRQNVLAHFSLAHLNKPKTVAVLVIVALAIVALTWAINTLSDGSDIEV